MACTQAEIARPVLVDILVYSGAAAENELSFGTIGFVDPRKLVFERHESAGKSKVKTKEVILRMQVFGFKIHSECRLVARQNKSKLLREPAYFYGW